jgi:hypothetical protein
MMPLRGEDGFTLMEVLTALTVGFVLLAATLGLLESSVRLNTGVMAKTDAMQRGRLGMDTVTQQLRSQVCLDWANSAIRTGSDQNSVTFFADFSAGDEAPGLRTLTYDAEERRIVLSITDAPDPLPDPLTPDSFPDEPDGRNLVLENVLLQDDRTTPDPNDKVPFLRYYAYEEEGDGVLRANDQLPALLDDDAEAARVARIDVSFLALPTGTDDVSKGVNLTDQVMARHADPNLAVPDPNCV